MADLGWADALVVFLLIAGFVLWLFGEIASRFNKPEQWDSVADQKRRTAKRARHLSREYR